MHHEPCMNKNLADSCAPRFATGLSTQKVNAKFRRGQLNFNHVKIIYMERRDSFIVHQVKSFRWAIEGIIYSYKKGTHFKFHILVLSLVIILGFSYSISLIEWLAIILVSSAVISAEAINTAIEETCDVLHPEHHPGAKLAKHCAAGGVLILSAAAVLVGLLIFIPKILS